MARYSLRVDATRFSNSAAFRRFLDTPPTGVAVSERVGGSTVVGDTVPARVSDSLGGVSDDSSFSKPLQP